MALKFLDNYRRRFSRLLTAPRDELTSWGRLLRYQVTLWRFCLKRLRRNNSLSMSSALSFRTIFALVPILVLAMLILKSTGQLEASKTSIRQFLETAGFSQIVLTEEPVPTGEEILRRQLEGLDPLVEDTVPPARRSVSLADRIEGLIDRVEARLTIGRLGPIGVVLLIWTALTLLTTLESSLNRIFDAPHNRPLVQRLLLYWGVVTLGPLVLSTAMYLGERGTEYVGGKVLLSWMVVVAGWLGPVLAMFLVLAAIYKLMPNTRVGFKAAMAGAAVALPVWLVAKWGFSVYVTEIVARKSIYGTLGLVPLFLFWLNLSWTIFLFGAEVAYTAGNLRRMQSEELAGRIVIGPIDRLAAALVVTENYLRGRGPVTFEDIARRLDLPDSSARWVVDRLVTLKVLSPAEVDGRSAYVPERPAEDIGVLEVMEVTPDGAEALAVRSYTPRIEKRLDRFVRAARDRLGQTTLADVARLEGEDAEAEG